MVVKLSSYWIVLNILDIGLLWSLAKVEVIDSYCFDGVSLESMRCVCTGLALELGDRYYSYPASVIECTLVMVDQGILSETHSWDPRGRYMTKPCSLCSRLQKWSRWWPEMTFSEVAPVKWNDFALEAWLVSMLLSFRHQVKYFFLSISLLFQFICLLSPQKWGSEWFPAEVINTVKTA